MARSGRSGRGARASIWPDESREALRRLVEGRRENLTLRYYTSKTRNETAEPTESASFATRWAHGVRAGVRRAEAPFGFQWPPPSDHGSPFARRARARGHAPRPPRAAGAALDAADPSRPSLSAVSCPRPPRPRPSTVLRWPRPARLARGRAPGSPSAGPPRGCPRLASARCAARPCASLGSTMVSTGARAAPMRDGAPPRGARSASRPWVARG